MLLVEGPALVMAWWWGHAEGKPAQPSGDPLLQLLELPSLGELWALLQRPHGPGGPLEAVAEALCSARGPRKPGGPSLNWYEANDLKELVGQEPVQTLWDSSLSE